MRIRSVEDAPPWRSGFRFRLAALVLSTFVPVLTAAQQPSKSLHVVRASGQATITAKPDQAEISLGVETNASTAEAAATQNAAQSTKLLGAIRQVLGSAGTVSTSQYSLTPEYRYKQDEPPTLTGYRADNTVIIKTGNLGLVPKIIDIGTQAGANRVTGISFTLQNDAAVRERALTEAAQRARANAEAIAAGLHLHVVRVVEAESGEAAIRPRQFVANKLMNPAAATPIEPATIQVMESVTVTLEVQ